MRGSETGEKVEEGREHKEDIDGPDGDFGDAPEAHAEAAEDGAEGDAKDLLGLGEDVEVEHEVLALQRAELEVEEAARQAQRPLAQRVRRIRPARTGERRDSSERSSSIHVPHGSTFPGFEARAHGPGDLDVVGG